MCCLLTQIVSVKELNAVAGTVRSVLICI